MKKKAMNSFDKEIQIERATKHSRAIGEEAGQQKKRKYSSRMRQLAPDVTTITDTYHYKSGDSPPQHTSLRQRNNIASQSSRLRKKMYLQLLEEQITHLELELDSTDNQIEMLRTGIFNALMHTDEVNSHSAQIQEHVLRKLKSLVLESDDSKRDSEINICLDSCVYRIGASGSERKAILDILYSGLINRNLPNIYRYIVWSAANRSHLFQLLSQKKVQDSWWNEIKQIGEQVLLVHGNFLMEKGEELGVKAREILRYSRQILKQKQEIERYGQSYDQLLKIFRQILTPVQFAQLFLFVERSIHKKQLQMFQDERNIIQSNSHEVQRLKKREANSSANSRDKIEDQQYGHEQKIEGRKRRKLSESL